MSDTKPSAAPPGAAGNLGATGNLTGAAAEPAATPGVDASPEGRPLSPAAQRALAEAAERRLQREAEAAARPRELDGRDGPDPARYGDWEKNGICSDF